MGSNITSSNDREGGFFDLLTEKEDRVSLLLEDIKTSNLPVFLYGAGHTALSIVKKINELGIIDIDQIVVSDDYEKETSLTICGKPVSLFSNAVKNYAKVNIILGVAIERQLILDQLKTYEQVNDVYSVDVRLNSECDVAHYIREHDKGFYDFYNSLADEKSKASMIAYFNQTVCGIVGYIGSVYESNQYFPGFMELSEREVFVDAGAFDGDTVHDFLKFLDGKSYDSIYSIEPDDINFAKLLASTKNVPRLNCINIGTWSKADKLSFSCKGSISSRLSNTSEAGPISTITVDSIDNIVTNKPVTFIKMDIEGAEYESLMGAEKIIRKYKPKLAICVYHKVSDLVLIPKLLRKFVPEYKFYLRAHSLSSSEELVLYAFI